MANDRRALLVACDTYSDVGLRGLISPGRDALELAEVLRNPAIGAFEIPESAVLRNEPVSAVKRAIEAFFKDSNPGDLLLLYLSCHGLKDGADGRLFYAGRDTDRRYLDSTSIEAEVVNRQMLRSVARRKVLLLDCCYSGAFAKGMVAKSGGDAVHLVEQFPDQRGRVVLTSSDSMQYSFEGEQVEGQGVKSVFTRAIIDGLRTGAAAGSPDGTVTTDDLYAFVYRQVRERTPNQTPRKWGFDSAGAIVLAKVVTSELLQQTLNAAERKLNDGHWQAAKADLDIVYSIDPNADGVSALLRRVEIEHHRASLYEQALDYAARADHASALQTLLELKESAPAYRDVEAQIANMQSEIAAIQSKRTARLTELRAMALQGTRTFPFSEAYAALNEALEISPGDKALVAGVAELDTLKQRIIGHYRLGYTAAEQGNWEEAAAEIKQCITLGGDIPVKQLDGGEEDIRLSDLAAKLDHEAIAERARHEATQLLDRPLEAPLIRYWLNGQLAKLEVMTKRYQRKAELLAKKRADAENRVEYLQTAARMAEKAGTELTPHLNRAGPMSDATDEGRAAKRRQRVMGYAISRLAVERSFYADAVTSLPAHNDVQNALATPSSPAERMPYSVTIQRKVQAAVCTHKRRYRRAEWMKGFGRTLRTTLLILLCLLLLGYCVWASGR